MVPANQTQTGAAVAIGLAIPSPQLPSRDDAERQLPGRVSLDDIIAQSASIERYIAQYRPQLVRCLPMPAAGDALWISDGGKEAKDWRAIDRSGAADDPKAAAIFSQGYPVIAVIYARCSSGLQRDASIEDPIRLCRARFERDGWQYRHRYTDRVISGASALRSAYQSLLEDARRGQFDIVVRGARPAVISSPDRWIVHEVP